MTNSTDSTPAIAEPLRSILEGYFNVELFWHSFPKDLQAYLALDPGLAERFKAQFAAAIVEGTLSAAHYQKLTGQSFDSEGALYAWLYKLWAEIYGNEPVPGDS